MTGFKHAGVNHAVFYLLGIPGREDLRVWFSILLCFSYVFALLGNGLLIFIILTKNSLHEPMYLFLCMYLHLCMLAGIDIAFATTTELKALAIFWHNNRDISLNGYIVQLYFQHSFFISESGILLMMAFDRNIAICYPLRYTLILTPSLVGKIGVAVFLRAHCAIFPIVFLLKRLSFCRNNILPHTFCEHIGLAKFACDDVQVNIWYGFLVLMSALILDMVLILVSYIIILCAVFHILSQDAHHKALSTCGPPVCVTVLYYGPWIFSVLTQGFGHYIPLHTHILLASVSMLAPPMLNPIIYGVKIKQIRDQMVYVLFPKQKCL